jgi:UDP-N-acetylmuramate--alanine ligase
MADWHGRRLHFVGIAGYGMSGLARLCRELGAEVTGSDQKLAPGHSAGNVPAGAELVYSSAIMPDNVERARGRELGLREIRRGELLAELTRLRRCIAVAGTSGKTTTAWMIVHMLRQQLRLSWAIGAELRDGSPNSAWDSGEWMVVEADESDRTFLALEPQIGVVTNVAAEHGTLEEMREAFAAFEARCGTVVKGVEAGQPELGPDGSRFRWRDREVRLPVPGAHNVANAVLALEACRLVGVDGVEALATYPGARRRLEPLGRGVYNDFAIHANEIRASLAALRTLGHERVVVVFEPLLYSRTRDMAADWGEALRGADEVVVLEVRAGSEAGKEPVSGRVVAEAANGIFDPAGEGLARLVRPGDACVFMGVGQTPQQLARELAGLG